MLRRVESAEGGQLIGRNGSGDYSGIIFPYLWPGEDYVREHRLRRDKPDLEQKADGSVKERGKYLSPPGRGNLLYFPPGTDPAWLIDASLPILLTEGEKKGLALWSLGRHNLTEAAICPRWLAVALPGVWNWRGTISKAPGPDGDRRDVKGVIPDFDRVTWKSRRVAIIFDRNVATNDSVAAARRELAKELTRRGASVEVIDLPDLDGVNGVDDLIGAWGADKTLDLIRTAARTLEVIASAWDLLLIKNSKGKPVTCLENALEALTYAPEWQGVLGFNESSLQVIATAAPPWNSRAVPFGWRDDDDVRAAAWMQRQGIMVGQEITGQAIQTIARENSFHPIRDYLNSLKWDGIARIDDWLTLYIGVDPSDYVRTVGAKFLIGGVARVYRPGCKNDSCLILEGPQGSLKSTALRTLADPWFTDDMPELGTKDAALQTRGVWIIELAELDAMTRAEVSRIKSFMSRSTDRFRPPYGKHLIETPRECVFAGTVNHSNYLKDETGARRFWPVACGAVHIDELRRDRDQLWAEAVLRYRAGHSWWLDSEALVKAAADEQQKRYDADPWQPVIEQGIEGREYVTMEQILTECLDKPKKDWTQGDKNRIARSLKALGWDRYQKRLETGREWRYRRSPVSPDSKVTR